MSLTGGFSRADLRAAYVEAWRCSRAGALLTPMQAMICDVVELHGEYQHLLEDEQRAQSHESDAAQNPFLHMGLHLAIREQISIDRPPGIRDLARLLRTQLGEHHWEHALMRVLGETLWEAQASGAAPDELQYLDRARGLLKVK